jgi:arylsulfatase A-like enzyme
MGLTGAETRHIVELIDIYPTLIELARLRAPGGLDGISLVPLLIDPSHAVKNEAFSVVQRPSGLGRTVRTERYRYTEWPDGSVELFDHSIDPRESINLAHSPAHSKTVSDLRARLHNRI